MLLVEIGRLRVVIAPRGEDIVAVSLTGTPVDLRKKSWSRVLPQLI